MTTFEQISTFWKEVKYTEVTAHDFTLNDSDLGQYLVYHSINAINMSFLVQALDTAGIPLCDVVIAGSVKHTYCYEISFHNVDISTLPPSQN